MQVGQVLSRIPTWWSAASPIAGRLLCSRLQCSELTCT